MDYQLPPTLGVNQNLGLGPAAIRFDGADANAKMVKIMLPAGDSENVPVILKGLRSVLENVDQAILDGIVQPTEVMMDATGNKYMKFKWNGVYFAYEGKDVTNQLYFQIPITFGSTYLLAPNVDQFFGYTARQGSNDIIGTRDFRMGLRELTTNNFYPFVLCAGDRNQDVPLNAGYFPHPTKIFTSATAFTSATDERAELWQDTEDFNIRERKGGFNLLFGPQNDAGIKWDSVDVDLTGVTGASVTASGLIPAGAILIGVATRVTTALGTTNGTTGYQIGDGSDVDRWGNKTGTDTTTHSDNSDATGSFLEAYNSAGDVVITANGGNFDGIGDIKVTAQFITNIAPNPT